jgi:hypothetical protein|tara:strand:- start:915 stop:1130 length:216 start_codon:yes stop_codon:yes gene_type:complete
MEILLSSEGSKGQLRLFIDQIPYDVDINLGLNKKRIASPDRVPIGEVCSLKWPAVWMSLIFLKANMYPNKK